MTATSDQNSFRVYELLEDRTPVWEFEFLGESRAKGFKWKVKHFNSKVDFFQGNAYAISFCNQEEVDKDREYFESHWHHYDIEYF